MNYATIGNLAFERGDGESIPDFRQRAGDAVADLGGGVLSWAAPEALEWIEAAPEIVEIEGGLKDGRADVATIGDQMIERESGESVEAFHRRARELAVASSCGQVIFGGLPRMNCDDDLTS